MCYRCSRWRLGWKCWNIPFNAGKRKRVSIYITTALGVNTLNQYKSYRTSSAKLESVRVSGGVCLRIQSTWCFFPSSASHRNLQETPRLSPVHQTLETPCQCEGPGDHRPARHPDYETETETDRYKDIHKAGRWTGNIADRYEALYWIILIKPFHRKAFQDESSLSG